MPRNDGFFIMSEIYGVTFPIPKSLVSRFLEDKKTVFIKPSSVYSALKPGMVFVIYQSQKDTGYVAEGLIKKIVFSEDPILFFDEFGEAIFLTKEEVEEYVKNTKKWRPHIRIRYPRQRKWMAIELEKIIKYKEIQKPERFVSVGGKYLKK